MTLNDWIKFATTTLSAASIQTANLDIIILLEDEIGKDRSWILAHPEKQLSKVNVGNLKNVLNRRAMHEPLAYIRGTCEFYGRSFNITHDVLQPRPESETFITLLATILDARKNVYKLPAQPCIADVGAGSGAIGTTIALEYPETHVEMLEIDPKAAKVAKSNVDLFTLKIPVILSDLLINASENIDILVCNLPYVPDTFHINKAASQEPKLAIFGGHDGLDVYRRLFNQIKMRSYKPLLILTESLPPQHSDLNKIASICGYSLKKTDDFVQVFARR